MVQGFESAIFHHRMCNPKGTHTHTHTAHLHFHAHTHTRPSKVMVCVQWQAARVPPDHHHHTPCLAAITILLL